MQLVNTTFGLRSIYEQRLVCDCMFGLKKIVRNDSVCDTAESVIIAIRKVCAPEIR